MFGVVFKYNRASNMVRLAVVDESTDKVVFNGDMTLNQLAEAPQRMGIEPINFSVAKGKVIQDVGVFDRLNCKHRVLVILKEIRTNGGRCLGYTVFDCDNCTIYNKKKEDIIKAQEAIRVRTNTSLIQNAIIRDGKVNCYPNHKFKRVIVGTKAKKVNKQVIRIVSHWEDADKSSYYTVKVADNRFVDVKCSTDGGIYIMQCEDGNEVFDKNKKTYNNVPLNRNDILRYVSDVHKQNKRKQKSNDDIRTIKYLIQNLKDKNDIEEAKHLYSMYMETDIGEGREPADEDEEEYYRKTLSRLLAKCKNKDDVFVSKAKELFGDASFISDERLSSDQKKILISAKKRGVPVEYINNPDYSNDVMSFYADNIVSEGLAKDCSGILNNPKLSIDQVNELYQCAVVGVDYSDICDESLSPASMQIERQRRSMKLWGDLSDEPPIDEELIEKCLKLKQDIMCGNG